MEGRIEDTSEKSKKNHITYYKSLSSAIQELKKEKETESDNIKHLEDRIDSLEKDKERIRKMFPEVDW